MTSTIVTPSAPENDAVACLIVGLAASGKTTLVKALNDFPSKPKAKRTYIINLDPVTFPLGISVTKNQAATKLTLSQAVLDVPYEANLDVRNTVNYEQVMNTYALGPNGGILTSMNLVATKFHQITDVLMKRITLITHALFDTPGQIEVFTTAAAGELMADSLSAIVPTIILYIIDVMDIGPDGFAMNMQYAFDVMIKTKLPLLIVFNKIDRSPENYAKVVSWMNDPEEFSYSSDPEVDTHLTDMARSMSQYLSGFIRTVNYVGISARSSLGIDDLLKVIELLRIQFIKVTRPSQLEQQKLAVQRMKDKLNQAKELNKAKDYEDEKEAKYADYVHAGQAPSSSIADMVLPTVVLPTVVPTRSTPLIMNILSLPDMFR